MSTDALKARGRALEEAFFAQKNHELLKAFHEKLEADERRAEIIAATGIKDEAMLDRLLQQGVDAQSIAAVTLIPLIRVAWADRTIDAKERDAILAAAKDLGIDAGESAYQLLQNWLEERPEEQLFVAWANYVAVLKTTLDSASFHCLGETVVNRTKSVAAAVGGVLGFGKISDVEQKVLDEISESFS
ncbi:hypothetical protein ACFL2H_03560 [Planctomycetota bacterium]